MLCPTLCSPKNCSMPDLPVPHYLLEFSQTHVSTESVMPSNHLILCCLLLLLPSAFPNIRVFPSELTLRIRWPKYWSFNFSISPSSEYIQGWYPLRLTGLISLLFKEFLRVCSSTTVQKHQFFSAPLYPALTSIHDYWKDDTLTVQIFVGKIMSLIFNTLSRFVVASLPRSNHLLISSLLSPSSVILVKLPWSSKYKAIGLLNWIIQL